MGWTVWPAAAVFLVITAVYLGGLAYGFALPFAPVVYHYQLAQMGSSQAADLLSLIVAYCFVFALSTLFFGMGAVLAGVLESSKFAYFLSKGMTPFDYIFSFPLFIAVLAASELGSAVSQDSQGQGDFRQSALKAGGIFLLGFGLLVLAYLLRPLLVK